MVTHCSTERMIADYFTKPLHGNLFTTMRDTIMGIIPYPTKERVQNKICFRNEREEIKHSTIGKGGSQVGREDTVNDAMLKV